MSTSDEKPLFAELSDVVGTTGTGLDGWVAAIVEDPGLNRLVDLDDITAGAQAADALNQMILNGIRATGVANDGTLNAADLYDVNRWIQADAARYDRFLELHGNDEDGVETGFHLVQNDGATGQLYARNAVNAVLDGAYHIGFDIRNGRFLNEDGDLNQDLEDTAYRLNDTLAEALADGTLANPDVDAYARGTTGTSLDQVVDIIREDIGLNRTIGTWEITEGATAADGLNQMIVDAIESQGLANDGQITASDVYAINAWFQADAARYERFVDLHGDDEDGVETGFHRVQNDGGETRLFGNDNAVNTVFDGLYHIGFDIEGGRLLNEDGDRNALVVDVAHWLDQLLRPTLAAGDLVNAAADPFAGVVYTGTGLDLLVDTIIQDEGLNRSIALSEIAEGAAAASGLNAIIVEAITETGSANDAVISALDLRVMNAWIQDNRYDEFVALHGDDEDGEETGFHLVQNDGDTSFLFNRAAVDVVADGLYHMGFDIAWSRFLNEDGDPNVDLNAAARWLNALLQDDLENGSLINTDRLPGAADPGAIAAAQVLGPLTESFDGTGSGSDLGHSADLALANGTIALTFTADDLSKRKALFSKDATGNDQPGHLTAWASESAVEVRFQDTAGQIVLKSKNFPISTGEDYDVAFSFGDGGAALYLNGVLVDLRTDFQVDLTGNSETLVLGANTAHRSDAQPDWRSDRFDGTIQDFTVYGRALELQEIGAIRNASGDGPVAPFNLPNAPLFAELSDVVGTTGTGLDGWVAAIVEDPGLNRLVDLDDITAGAQAADALNQMILNGIRATGVANDGTLNAADLYDVNRWIQADAARYDRFLELHGNDEDGVETGFHLVQNDGATGQLYARNAVNAVLDGAYHIGFDIRNGRFLNEDGDLNQDLEDTAYRLNDTLAEALADGTLANPDVDAYARGTTGTSLDQVVDIIREDIGLNRTIGTWEITEGATAADGLNQMIVDAIESQGLANDGQITASDVYAINAWFQADAARYERFVDLHGDDEDGVETGFHRVQNDGGETRLFGNDNAVNTVFDGLYHIGFDIEGGRLLNEDGDRNALVVDVAHWLDQLLRPTLAAGDLVNAAADPFAGVVYTGTGLDLLVDTIIQDEGLNRSIALSEIAEGAAAASGLNAIIVEAITETGSANDAVISALDLRVMNAWIQDNRYDEFVALHGDDEDGEETGFHLVQNDGDTSFLFNRAAVDVVADGLYHMGFDIAWSRFLNEDGDPNVDLNTAARWLNGLLEDDLQNGSLINTELVADAATLDPLYGDAVVARRSDSFDGTTDSQVELAHRDALELANGTIALSFTADDVDGNRTLFSKDFSGFQKGGHVTASLKNGRLEVLFQSDDKSTFLDVNDIRVAAGERHSMAFSFGDNGARLYFDGQLADAATDMTTDLTLNTNSLVLGARTSGRTDRNPDQRGDPFDGTIEDFAIFDRALTDREVAQLYNAPADYDLPNADPMVADDGPVFGFAGDRIDIPVADLLANDVDANGDPLSITGVADAKGGNVERLGDVVRFTADGSGDTGSFTYTVEDGQGGSATAGVTLDIKVLPDGLPKPVLVLDPQRLIVEERGDHALVAHTPDLELANGTVALSFTTDSLGSDKAMLFSKDAAGLGGGGHVTAFVTSDDLVVRFQSTTGEVHLKARDTIEAGRAYDFAFTFGEAGAQLYLDGALVDERPDVLIDLTANTESLAIGANTWGRQPGTDGNFLGNFDGTIESFAIFDQALTPAEQDLWLG